MRSHLAVAALLVAVSLSGCSALFGPSDDECGKERKNRLDLKDAAAVQASTPLAASDGIEWQLDVAEACSLRHAQVFGYVTLDKSLAPAGCKPVTGVAGDVYTSLFLQPRGIVFSGGFGTGTRAEFEGETEVGLKQTAPDGQPGSYTVAVRVLVERTADNADIACVKPQVVSLTIVAEDHAYKAAAST